MVTTETKSELTGNVKIPEELWLIWSNGNGPFEKGWITASDSMDLPGILCFTSEGEAESHAAWLEEEFGIPCDHIKVK